MTVKVGDKVRIIDADPNEIFYANGDIFHVVKLWEDGGGVDVCGDDDVDIELYTREFEVIPRNPHAELNAEPMGNEVGTEDNHARLLAKTMERVTELESVIRRMKEALAND